MVIEDKEVRNIIKQNIGKDVIISAGYTDITGKVIKLTSNFVVLEISKKRETYVKIRDIVTIEVEKEVVKMGDTETENKKVENKEETSEEKKEEVPVTAE